MPTFRTPEEADAWRSARDAELDEYRKRGLLPPPPKTEAIIIRGGPDTGDRKPKLAEQYARFKHLAEEMLIDFANEEMKAIIEDRGLEPGHKAALLSSLRCMVSATNERARWRATESYGKLKGVGRWASMDTKRDQDRARTNGARDDRPPWLERANGKV